MALTDAKTSRPLDDVMIAMDVVDTLRHDKRIVERELDVEARRRDLIEQLREIYKGQGIDVPDQILADGVKALEEKRFVYTPPADSLQLRLARLYVSREQWGKTAGAAVLGATLVGGGWYVAYERPRQVEATQQREEAEIGLPRRVALLEEQIKTEAKNPTVVADAVRIAESARVAAKAGQLTAARDAEGQLKGLVEELRRDYDIRIINRQGEVTGLWRVPKVNPLSRNYYLVVEAIDRSGKPVPRDILNEETGQRETVTKWAVRVAKELFDQVQADKLDDGIIQKSVLAAKARGEAEPTWRIAVPSGALTRW